MSRGNHILREVMKHFNPSQELTESSQGSLQTIPDKQSKVIGNEKTEEERKIIQLRKKQKNTLIRLTSCLPSISTGHLYKLFGVFRTILQFLGINQRALEDPDFDESYFSTHLHDRAVEKVQLYDNAVVVHLAEPQAHNTPFSLAQIIQKFRRKGNAKFGDLSQLILQVCQLLGSIKREETPPEKPESLKKCLDSLGDGMFIVSTGLRTVAIAKSLLEYLQYDIDEFSVQAVKYKGIYMEFFSSSSYFLGLVHMLNCLKYTVQLNKNQITLSEFRELTNFHFTDFAYSKNHVKSFCDMNINLITPSILCHRINFVYYKADELGWKSGSNKMRMKAIESEKERIRQNEYRVIKRVKDLPESLFNENRRLVAQYKDKETTQPQKMDEA